MPPAHAALFSLRSHDATAEMGPYSQPTSVQRRRRPATSAGPSLAAVGSSQSLASLYGNTLTFDSTSKDAKETALGKIGA